MEPNTLTVAYITARHDCRCEWFFDSLVSQLDPEDSLRIIVVDHWHDERGHFNLPGIDKIITLASKCQIQHIPPKPSVWQGPNRLTDQDWFAMSNARNTALCLCETAHLAYVDDLSVLAPSWLRAAKEAVAGNYIGCGSYQKMRNMVVENGRAVSYDEFPEGKDARLKRVHEDISPCPGGWLFGCSCVFPVEALLTVGGWPEYVDGLSSEDCILGIVLKNAGFDLRFDTRMLTLESEELHSVEPAMKRIDKGVSPRDKSHAAIDIARGSNYFPNYYEGAMRKLREDILSGKSWPTAQIPERDWYDGEWIQEMK